MLSRPSRGERPAFVAGRREECVRHSPRAVERGASGIRRVCYSLQTVEKRASGIRHRHCIGESRTFSAGHAGVSSMLSCPLRGERPAFSAGRQE